MTILERISIDPKVMHGKPCIKGTRIPVYLILNLLAGGLSESEILHDYPDLAKEDIRVSIRIRFQTVALRVKRGEKGLFRG